MMNVSKWLELTDISLDIFNDGTQPSLEHPLVPHTDPALFRLSGLEVIIKVNCTLKLYHSHLALY